MCLPKKVSTYKMLLCKECGKERQLGRRLCRTCNSKRVAKYPRYTWSKVCEVCKKNFPASRKRQTRCSDCYKLMQEIKARNISSNSYIYSKIPGHTEHRDIAERLVGRKLQTNEVVHHLDENPRNNEVQNLLVIDRRTHGKLHLYLNAQRVILEKSGIENIENCWNNLRVPMTTTWLEMANVKVIKLWEIGQSAAEPLKVSTHEEGSETMHDAPVTEYAVGEDIVQTTTV